MKTLLSVFIFLFSLHCSALAATATATATDPDKETLQLQLRQTAGRMSGQKINPSGIQTFGKEKHLFSNWREYSSFMRQQTKMDRENGYSYIISGSLAFVGGIAGAAVANDPLENGVYTVFQTIGVASIGYGAYQLRIGDDERQFFETIHYSRLDARSRFLALQAHEGQRRRREEKDRLIRVVTHGLIAALNFYNGSVQENKSLKTGLYFIGGVNALAALSFTFEF